MGRPLPLRPTAAISELTSSDMAQPSLVIFDCDGVLIDSELIACRVDAECLTEAGFPTTTDFVRENFIGVSSRVMFERVERDHGRKLPADFPVILQLRLSAAFSEELEAIAGVADMLPALGVKTCVASSSQPERLRHTLGVTGLWPHFDPHVFSATMVTNGKPAPDLFLYAADKMSVAPQDCVVVEDSRAGVAAGRAAGMRVLGFAGGSHCGPDHAAMLREAGADTVFNDMTRLPELLAA
jgi:HAD superfamily hydrolase (TIGR01509 family)